MEDFNSLLDDPGAAVGVDKHDESVLGARRVGVVNEDAARVVELIESAEDLDNLESGVGSVREETGALDPPIEVERVVGGRGGVENVVDKGRVEGGDHGTDRVLKTSGPCTVRHHSTDCEFDVGGGGGGGFVARGLGLRLRLRLGRRVRRVGVGESFGCGEGG